MGNLQLFSFIINENTVDDVTFYTFKLPESVARICEEISQGYKNSAAYKTIFKVAISCFPDIIYCNNRIHDIQKDNNIWFYAIQPFDLELLKVKIYEWLSIEYCNRLKRELREKFEEEWVLEQNISLKDVVRHASASELEVIYNIIPSYYIYVLSQQEFRFTSLPKNLRFNRVVGEERAMMMTMPVEITGKIYSPFSYYIDSQLFLPIDGVGFCLNFWLHIKRWENGALIKGNKNYVTGKESTTMYVSKANPYYYTSNTLFNSISVKRDEGKEFKFVQAADELYTQLLEVNLEEVLKIKGTNKGGVGETIFISRKNKGKSSTKVGAGLKERNEMLEIIQHKLPNLQLRDTIQYLGKPQNGKLTKLSEILDQLKQLEIEPQYLLKEDGSLNRMVNKYAYITNKYYKSFKIYVASNTEDLYKKVVEISKVSLRLKQVDEACFVNNEGKEIRIEEIKNPFCTTLTDRDERDDREQLVQQSFCKSKRDELGLAIIDLENYSLVKNMNREQDPKNLIREVCRKSGILTQFIDYQDKKVVMEQVMNAVKDLYSAAGFMESIIYEENIVNPEDILVGIGKISTGKNDNILAMTRIVQGRIELNIYGVNKWMNVQEYIFKLNIEMLGKMKIVIPKGKTRQVQDEIDHWIKSELTSILEEGEMVYTFIDYSLRNKLWSVARNKDFLNSGNLPIASRERLRLIRVNGGEEIPEYYIESKPDNLNKESGIFKGKNSTYYLVGRRSGTDQVGKTLTKCDAPTKSMKRPGLQEINIQGCENEEERDEVARLTQILRGANLSYDSHTALPLPLYCMGRITEYIRAMY